MRPSSRGARPVTSARPMSGRTGTVATPSASREAAYGVALAQEVQVSDRPVTQQGMSGMKTAGGGRGRLVQDGSYFLGIVRSKINDIQKELRVLQDEAARQNTDASQLGQLERRYETLLQEVKGLEGSLADHNLSMDKVRTSADAGEVLAFAADLEDRNRRTAQEVDGVFLAKSQRERAMAETEAETARLHADLAAKIDALEPHKLRQYQELLSRSSELHAAAAERQAEVDALAAAVRDNEARANNFSGSAGGAGASMGPDAAAAARQEYQDAERLVTKLRREAGALQRDLEALQLEPKQAREALLARVKADQDASRELDRLLAETRAEVERLRRRAAADADDAATANNAPNGLNGGGGGGGSSGGIDPSKVEALQKREQEMTDFLARFEAASAEAMTGKRQSQQTIVALLEHIASGLDAQHHIPDADKMKELQDESTFKEKQLRSSEQTMRRLEQERDKRQQELEKIDRLDEKIPPEIEALKQRIEQMKEEMVILEDTAGLRRQAEATKEHLQELRAQYNKRRASIKSQVQQLSQRHEATKKALAANEVAKGLDALEQKLRSHETSIFQLREFVETKGREIDFDTMRSECRDMVDKVNDIIIRSDLSEHFATPY